MGTSTWPDKFPQTGELKMGRKNLVQEWVEASKILHLVKDQVVDKWVKAISYYVSQYAFYTGHIPPTFEQ